METTIKLSDLIIILKRFAFLIISVTIIFIGIAIALNNFVLKPVYKAETQILVNQKYEQGDQYLSSQQIDADLQLINTYNVIIKSPVILTKVINNLQLESTPEELTQQISVSSTNNSQVLTIQVEDSSPAKAVEISNEVAQVFESNIPQLMKVDNINILSIAKLDENPTPIKPNKILNMGIAAIVGLLLGIGIAILIETFDTRIKSERDIEEMLELPVIGSVGPIVEDKRMIFSRKEKKKMPTQSRRVGGV
ncbi:capsular biosynthesis protein [Rummeliibacillus sp. TYF005]|uniref:YveK family protein n=1 Tax=Rummeliibacillus sp. TYF005 TaxID=2058214 RepID=UPI000F51FC10|nr:Wzz/FepE/Etk N-terminal domain-containing protein [Rummeliibacillus sp. TYF005]RPJ96699.1 capsular biosynthesis protein [Rummeliibacillus sp. TYF005]